ncbi:hypothetical protein ANO11243_076260 [Dothideomycetidae sp. 11243]|nr:hypothetical protein ANO11243_076260 [fungal sp. No.11243]
MSSTMISQPCTRAVNISLLVLTSGIATIRLLLPLWLDDMKLGWKDAWLAAALACYISMSIVYAVTMPVIYKIGAVADGSATVYAGVIQDAEEVLKVVFATTMLHWCVLWGVKFSMLAFYKGLLARLRVYMRLWWAVAVFTSAVRPRHCFMWLSPLTVTQAFFVSVFQFWFTCKDPAHMLIVGECLSPTATRLSHVSLWLSFALDILTDIMIIFLPLGIIRQARMPLKQKISIGSIFCLAFICVASSIIRVHEVGENMRGTKTPSITWLALWSLVEASIAIIIGSGPSLYEAARRRAAQYKSKSKSSTQASKAGGSKPLGSKTAHWQQQDLEMSDYAQHDASLTQLSKSEVKGIHSDAASSQEQLTLPITVTHSTDKYIFLLPSWDQVSPSAVKNPILPSRKRHINREQGGLKTKRLNIPKDPGVPSAHIATAAAANSHGTEGAPSTLSPRPARSCRPTARTRAREITPQGGNTKTKVTQMQYALPAGGRYLVFLFRRGKTRAKQSKSRILNGSNQREKGKSLNISAFKMCC